MNMIKILCTKFPNGDKYYRKEMIIFQVTENMVGASDVTQFKGEHH